MRICALFDCWLTFCWHNWQTFAVILLSNWRVSAHCTVIVVPKDVGERFSYVNTVTATVLPVILAGDLESVWTAHCRNESGLLSSYAEAMRRLATDVWPRQHRVTRIDWCVNACQEYFLGTGLQRVREKARRRQIYSLVRGVRLPQDKQTATDCGCRDRHLCGNRDNMPSSSTGQQSFEGCDHSASSLLSAGDECADFMSLSDLPSVEEDRAESELVRSQTVFEEACQMWVFFIFSMVKLRKTCIWMQRLG